MKLLVIPDVHGTTHWEKPCRIDEFDKIIFLGDYFDSFTIPWKNALENFVNILYFKNQFPDKVVLLAGNHDNHYIYYHTPSFREVKCSGFSASAAWKLNRILNENLRSIQAAWEHGNILMSHAGITEKHYLNDIEPIWDKTQPLSDFLTLLWKQANPRIFKIGFPRGGSDNYGSIFWADKSELEYDPKQGLYQVVGHTPIQHITTVKSYFNETKVTFTDCVEHREQEYLVINV